MSKETYTRKEFIETYGPYIHKVVTGTGILPGTLIAQAILESSGNDKSGEWRVGGSRLSREANNFFGIKAIGNYKGPVFNIATGEYDSTGNPYMDPSASFRRYKSVKDSIKDYVSFLKENKRYAENGVFEAKTVKEQADRLKKAGYATAPNYATMVNSIYESVKMYIQSEYEQFYHKKKLQTIIVASTIVIGVTALLIYTAYKE